MVGGFKMEGYSKDQYKLCKPSDGVKENGYHTVLG